MSQPNGLPTPAVTKTPRRLRYREFTFVPDTQPDAEPTTVAMQCCVCGESSEPDWNPEEANSWGLDHLKHNPEHYTYRTITTSPVWARPGTWL